MPRKKGVRKRNGKTEEIQEKDQSRKGEASFSEDSNLALKEGSTSKKTTKQRDDNLSKELNKHADGSGSLKKDKSFASKQIKVEESIDSKQDLFYTPQAHTETLHPEVDSTVKTEIELPIRNDIDEDLQGFVMAKGSKKKKGKQEEVSFDESSNQAETVAQDTMLESADTGKRQILNRSVTLRTKKELNELIISRQTPQCGTKGYPITIETNHLILNLGRLKRVVHYDVTITSADGASQKESRNVKKLPKKLLRQLMEEFRKKFYENHNPGFDGSKNLYSREELPFGKYFTGDLQINEKGRVRSFNITIKFAKIIDFTSLDNFMNANFNTSEQSVVTPREAIQCLDVILRNVSSMSCIPSGRYFFISRSFHKSISLGGGMELYNGFYQSVVVGSKLYLNIDVAHKVFPAPLNVIELIMELCNRKPEDLQISLESREEHVVNSFIHTLKITYSDPTLPETKRIYIANRVEKSAVDIKFTLENGTRLSVQEYFLQNKRVALKYPYMPCVRINFSDREPIHLPAELCSIQEGQVIDNRKIPEVIMNDVIKRTATSTTVRKQKIMESLQRIGYNKDNCVHEFGISVEEDFTKVNARVLKPPELAYKVQFTAKPHLGTWRPQKFHVGAVLTKWTVVNLDLNLRRNHLENLTKMICDHSRAVGMSVEEPIPSATIKLSYGKEFDTLKQLLQKKKDLQLIILVFPQNYQHCYNYIKQAAELSVGCLTQCVKSHTVSKLNASIVMGILQKINAKLLGTNHILHDSAKWMEDTPYMIMGADVTHPGKNVIDKPSIAAVTASFDREAFKYHLCWRLQPPAAEIIEDLENITLEHLEYFSKNTNGRKPERIIFLRDGVSEGQFSAVLDIELQAIRRACFRMYPHTPKITFLVVQKRHHTRFFPINPRDASKDKNLNVPVGTCVDTDIVHPTALNFYLVSHHSVQGVARPTKYYVLWDDAKMSWDELEELVLNFCHMVSRCTKSISYSVPTYYAHLAAARVKVYCGDKKIKIDNLKEEQERLQIMDNIIKGHPMFFV